MSNTATDTIRTAARLGNGDYRAAVSALARFCTEALADCAASTEVPTKFASDQVPTWRTLTRDESVARLCGWVSWQRILTWSDAYEVARRAAIAAMPEAMAELGAAL